MTTHKEYESPYISREFVDKLSPHLASNRLPRVLKSIREQKIKSSQEKHTL